MPPSSCTYARRKTPFATTGTITEAASLGSFNTTQLGPSYKILDSFAAFWSLETRLDKDVV